MYLTITAIKEMSKLVYNQEENSYYLHCPGCNTTHSIKTGNTDKGSLHVHKFDENFDKPTFSPSVIVDYGLDGVNNRRVCHFFVTEGRLDYQNCFHSLRNTSVALQDIPETLTSEYAIL